MTISREMTETMANGYSYDSTQRELSNDRVKMNFITFCFFMCWMNVTSAAKELRETLPLTTGNSQNTQNMSEKEAKF